MKPGTYKCSGGGSLCYYAVNSHADGANIISNNVVQEGAPAIATVGAGTYFETSDHGKWVLQ